MVVRWHVIEMLVRWWWSGCKLMEIVLVRYLVSSWYCNKIVGETTNISLYVVEIVVSSWNGCELVKLLIWWDADEFAVLLNVRLWLCCEAIINWWEGDVILNCGVGKWWWVCETVAWTGEIMMWWWSWSVKFVVQEWSSQHSNTSWIIVLFC